MRIVTNPGSNIPPELVKAYGIALAPQKLVVDDVVHDTRAHAIPLSDVDEWVKTAKVYPYVLGSSAAEFIELFRTVGKEDPQILVVMTSRKIVGSYIAAVSAVRTLKSSTSHAHLDIRIVDTELADLGVALPCALAGMGAKEGLALAEVTALVEIFSRRSAFAFVPDTLDWLVANGKVTTIRAWIANVLSLRPLIAMEGGELVPREKLNKDDDKVVAGLVAYALRKVPAGRPVWVGISHGGAPRKAALLEAAVRQAYDVRYVLTRQLHASIYHSVGPRALALWVGPIDGLPWTPPRGPSGG